MISNPVAETSASNSAISNQGTGPTTSPEQSINRDPVEQGNTSTEKSLNNPLSEWDQVELVQQAMNQRHKQNFDQWGSHVFGTTLSPYTEDGYTLVAYSRFFRDLLLFIAKPEMSAKFARSIPDGLDMIQTLSDLFLELQGLGHYEEYAIYHGLSHMQREDKPEFLYHAREYLTGDDLRQVMEANGKEPVDGQGGPASIYGLLRPEYLQTDLDTSAAAVKDEAVTREEKPAEAAEKLHQTAGSNATGAATTKKPASSPTKKSAPAKKSTTTKKA